MEGHRFLPDMMSAFPVDLSIDLNSVSHQLLQCKLRYHRDVWRIICDKALSLSGGDGWRRKSSEETPKPRPEPKPEPKPETKPEPKPEPKPAPKPAAKPPPKPADKKKKAGKDDDDDDDDDGEEEEEDDEDDDDDDDNDNNRPSRRSGRQQKWNHRSRRKSPKMAPAEVLAATNNAIAELASLLRRSIGRDAFDAWQSGLQAASALGADGGHDSHNSHGGGSRRRDRDRDRDRDKERERDRKRDHHDRDRDRDHRDRDRDRDHRDRDRDHRDHDGNRDHQKRDHHDRDRDRLNLRGSSSRFNSNRSDPPLTTVPETLTEAPLTSQSYSMAASLTESDEDNDGVTQVSDSCGGCGKCQQQHYSRHPHRR